MVGRSLGLLVVGSAEGDEIVGSSVGILVGSAVGSSVGSDGAIVKSALGKEVGSIVGNRVGRREGFLLGFLEGRAVVGEYVGLVGQGSLQIDAVVSQNAAGLQQSALVLQPYDSETMHDP